MIQSQTTDLANHTSYEDPFIYQGQNGSPKLLAIGQTSGITLFETKFDKSFKYKGQLLAIGINALRLFLLDSFQRTNITRIKIDELTVRMANIDDIVVYYVYDGNHLVNENKFANFIERLVTMDCWRRFSQSEFNIYKKDTKSIALMVQEIFVGQ